MKPEHVLSRGERLGCEVCKHFAWDGRMRAEWDARGVWHHPACRTSRALGAPPVCTFHEALGVGVRVDSFDARGAGALAYDTEIAGIAAWKWLAAGAAIVGALVLGRARS